VSRRHTVTLLISINPMFLKNTLMFVCNDLDVFKKHKVD